MYANLSSAVKINVKYEYGGSLHLLFLDTWSLCCHAPATRTSFSKTAQTIPARSNLSSQEFYFNTVQLGLDNMCGIMLLQQQLYAICRADTDMMK